MLHQMKGTGALLLLLLFLPLLLWGCGSSATVAVKPAEPVQAAQAADTEVEPGEPADLDQDMDVSNSMGPVVKNAVDQLLGQVKRTLYTNSGYATNPECLLAVDCSYYVKQVLKGLPPIYYTLLQQSSGKTTALAEDYYEFFSGLPTEFSGTQFWIRVEHIKDVRPGDIIACKYKDQDGPTTGHVMVAYTRAVQSRCSDKDQHWLYVSDSARSGHADDTRNSAGRYAKTFQYTAYEGGGGEPSGAGIGKMWFNTGKKPSYRWKSCSGAQHADFLIAIGRPMQPVRLK